MAKNPMDKTTPSEGIRGTRRFSTKGLVVIVIGVALAIFSVVFFAVPLQTVPYTVTEKYQATEVYITQEPYTVQEPYIETETYYETEPFITYETYTEREAYNKSVPVDYIVVSKGSYRYFWSTGFDVWVNIKNTDIKSGTFNVVFNITLSGGATTTKSASKYIAIGDTEQVEVSYSGALLASYTYSITPPTKTITDYRDVEKTREVTEYRDVEKTREVTQYRTVTKYREVPKQRTVEKERPATRYKKVTPFDYLLNY